MAKCVGSTTKPNGRVKGGTRPPGVISVLEVYRVDEAKARLGWSDSALRAAKRRGLRLLVCGKRRFLTGNEIVRFLESQGSDSRN
jgi:hypothetical protein